MAKYFAYVYAVTNTASTTVPMWTLVADATRPRRMKVYRLVIGPSGAPQDYSAEFALRRISARGTQSATVVPNPLDSNDIASEQDFDTTWSVNPTITASSELLVIPMHHKNTVDLFFPPGTELEIPKTAGAGLALMSKAVSTATTYTFGVYWEE